jgi:hypothetical protein
MCAAIPHIYGWFKTLLRLRIRTRKTNDTSEIFRDFEFGSAKETATD